MKTTLLLVTWMIGTNPPVNYQATFTSIEACQAARFQLGAELARLRADWETTWRNALVFNVYPGPSPELTAICAPQ